MTKTLVKVESKADLQFEIDQLRKEKMIYGIESLAVSVMALMVAVFLPELLYRMIFSNPTSSANPDLLNNIAPAAFGLAFVFFVFALVGNIVRCVKLSKLEKLLKTVKK